MRRLAIGLCVLAALAIVAALLVSSRPAAVPERIWIPDGLEFGEEPFREPGGERVEGLFLGSGSMGMGGWKLVCFSRRPAALDEIRAFFGLPARRLDFCFQWADGVRETGGVTWREFRRADD